MPRNGQGIYTLPVGNPVITGTTITSTWGNTTMQDIANALTGSVASDGQTTMSGPLNMGSNRINNVDNPVLPQDAATMDYVDTIVGDLGTMARQNADNVQITGGSIIGVYLDLRGTTGQMYLPRGTTAQRTSSPVVGLLRFNTDTYGTYHGFYEGYTTAGWQRFVTVNELNYNIDFLVVGGGGGGGGGTGGGPGGGGGAGGFIESSTTLESGTNYTIVVGGGGSQDVHGSNSSLEGIATAIGGGQGGGPQGSGASGGSGGGGGSGAGDPTRYGVGGAGTPDQGSAGGRGETFVGGGGGGASAVGGAASGVQSGGGGAGKSSSITGSLVWYCGGGGGGANGSDGQSSGGIGGGGGTAQSGVPNTGGGGGGFRNGVGTGFGGSGIVVLSIPTLNYSGQTTGNPQVSVVGDNTILKYLNSGTYTA